VAVKKKSRHETDVFSRAKIAVALFEAAAFLILIGLNIL